MVNQSNDGQHETKADVYQPPALTHYGTIEEWTRGDFYNGIVISIVL